jgi:predicted aconitase with swiveling domain
MMLRATPILPGAARGEVIRLASPISFWGGVDPHTGRLTDPNERHVGESISKRIMMIPETRGSSSSSAVLLQLVYEKLAPAAIILGRVDAILGLGIIVGREMKWPVPSLFVMAVEEQEALSDGDFIDIAHDGTIRRK